ncbi:MAG TPA: response regulator transcription factor [Anaerolineales bacterium]|nr:response regulator transcription factor [Anaerolineales bacterium]
MDRIRVLIVDDHPMMREALKTALEEESDMEVVDEAANGLEAIALANLHHPDVIMMDLLMPDMNGLEAITHLVEADANIKILVVTSLEDEEKVTAAIQAGALGYFPKTAPRAFLLEAIRKVADGVPYLPAGIAKKLFSGLRNMKTAVPGRSAVDEPLTARQEEILALLGEGHSDQAIGQALHLSEATVRSHVHRVLQRLGLKSRAQMVAYANGRRQEEK